MTQYSTLLYRCPGVHRGPGGRMYDYIESSSEGQTDSFLKEGWFLSLDEAVEAAKVSKEAAEPVPASSSMTAEEKAAAAKKALTVAAERALVAKRTLAADTKAAEAANKELIEATGQADAAGVEKDAAVERANVANVARVQAASKAHTANKALSSSKLHTEAAKKVLDDAALRVLASDQLLSEASAKALAGAEAAEKALAVAEGKGVSKPVLVSADSTEKEVTFDDVRAALMKLKDEVNAKAVTKLLKRFNVAAAPELSEDKYSEVVAAVEKELK